MVDIQKMVETMNSMVKKERSGYHVTLGKLIKALEAVDPNEIVKFDDGFYPHPDHIMSYRGYYSDLMIEPRNTETLASELLTALKAILGTTLYGYKGGEYLMDENTPLWKDHYGEVHNEAIVMTHTTPSGLILLTKKLDDE